MPLLSDDQQDLQGGSEDHSQPRNPKGGNAVCECRRGIFPRGTLIMSSSRPCEAVYVPVLNLIRMSKWCHFLTLPHELWCVCHIWPNVFLNPFSASDHEVPVLRPGWDRLVPEWEMVLWWRANEALSNRHVNSHGQNGSYYGQTQAVPHYLNCHMLYHYIFIKISGPSKVWPTISQCFEWFFSSP